MAPQDKIPVAANVLGTIGTAVCWCVQTIPQIWTNWRRKKTDGLPGSMMFIWALCGVPFGTYSVVQNFNIPIQVQPQAFMGLCLVCWVQILIYHDKWRIWTASLVGLATAGTFAGVETALILTIKPIYDRGNNTPVLVVGIIASVLLVIGLLPPYWEIWKRRGRVIGINWIFISVDWCGAFFSLMALVAQNTFDVLGGILYIICCFLEIGIFASHIIWLVRTHKIRKEAKVHGKTFDDIAAEHEEQGIPFKFAERKSRKERRRKNDEEKVLPTEESERVQNREEAIFGSEESTQPGRTASRE
ncbi:PQ loop repeat protein [Pleurostoma richardsiae]|uniref:PQ loop repeat protein n=1 Tax=Pleurostoma richardsiae TaxID=41990 RepID=A0AA38VJ35_9PEZI|nr:PQ loop repeat protein [Pleurostoma richardsiae]